MSLKVFIGGMRGSRPCTGQAFEIYGGDTTSVLVLGPQNEKIVLDAGSGLTHVSDQLAEQEPGDVTLLFSHYHLDHMIGLTMNALFYDKAWQFHCLGPALEQVTVKDAMTGLLAQPYWPIACSDMPASFEFETLCPQDEIQVGTLRVRACAVPHPGGCYAYRIEHPQSDTALVFATDMEWRKRTQVQERAFLELCCEPYSANLLLMDAHFERAQAEAFDGWGHSCWQDDLSIALSTGVSHVLLGHHAPDMDDARLLNLEQHIKQQTNQAALARTGQWITLEAGGKVDICQ